MTQEICEGKHPATFGTSEKWCLGIFGPTVAVGNLEFLGLCLPQICLGNFSWAVSKCQEFRSSQTPQCQESRRQKCVGYFLYKNIPFQTPGKCTYSKSHTRKVSPCPYEKTSGVCSTRYCWWTKSCTTWDTENPVNNGRLSISTGAGFLPPTVCWSFHIYIYNIFFVQQIGTRFILLEENSVSSTWFFVTLSQMSMYFKINLGRIWFVFYQNMFCVLVVPTLHFLFWSDVPSQSSNSCDVLLGMLFFGDWYLDVPRNQRKAIEI